MRLLSFSILLITFSSCSQEEKVIEIYKPYEGPLAEIHKVESLFSDSSIVRVKMNAPVQYELQNEDREFPKGISILFFDTKGNTESTLTANYAKYDAETKKYNVKGDVVIRNIEKGEQLNSEELFWDPGKEEIFVPEDVQVRVQTQTEMLLGKGLTAKQDFSSYKILKPTGIFSIEK